MQLITVATFESERPAQVLGERLTAAGIPAQAVDERKLQRYWFLVRPHAGVRLKVPTEYYEGATEMLERWDAESGALREAFRCPECGSSRLDYPQMTRNFILPTLICHVFSLLGFFRHHAYCKHCHHTWELPRTLSKEGAQRRPARQEPETR